MNTHETTQKTGAELIAEERQRQIEKEGWTPEHDQEHGTGEILKAAFAYAYLAVYREGSTPAEPYRLSQRVGQAYWPWEPAWFKPSPDPIRNLQKAGALIAAEIDRLRRLPTTEETH